jgi:hypothetical protein
MVAICIVHRWKGANGLSLRPNGEEKNASRMPLLALLHENRNKRSDAIWLTST